MSIVDGYITKPGHPPIFQPVRLLGETASTRHSPDSRLSNLGGAIWVTGLPNKSNTLRGVFVYESSDTKKSMKIYDYDDTYTYHTYTHIYIYTYVCVCVIMSELYLVDLGRFDRSYCWLSNIAKKPSWDLLVIPRPSSRRVWCSSLPRHGQRGEGKKGVAP